MALHHISWSEDGRLESVTGSPLAPEKIPALVALRETLSALGWVFLPSSRRELETNALELRFVEC